MYYRAVQVKGRAYANLIMHLVRHCDVVTFNVPYFHWKVGTTKPTVISDREMVSYLEEIENFLEWLRPYIIDDYFDNKYVGQTCGHMMRILTVRLSADIFDCFIAQDSIFDWDFPTDVQDLCFFSKGKCFVRTISHEKIFEVYEDYEPEIKILKKMGVKLKNIDLDVPNYELHYTLSF